MKITVIIYSNDPETIWNGFRFANMALALAERTTVFLLGKGVEATTCGTLDFDVMEQMNIFRSEGGHLLGCGVCCDNRQAEMPFLKQELACEMGSMAQLAQVVLEADKVVTF